jgi:hypothetical protein
MNKSHKNDICIKSQYTQHLSLNFNYSFFKNDYRFNLPALVTLLWAKLTQFFTQFEDFEEVSDVREKSYTFIINFVVGKV